MNPGSARSQVDAPGSGAYQRCLRALRHQDFRRALDHAQRRAQFMTDIAPKKAFAITNFAQLRLTYSKSAYQHSQFIGAVLLWQGHLAALCKRHDRRDQAIGDWR